MAGHVPQRVCVVCRKPSPKADLIKLIRAPGGRIGWPGPRPQGGKGLYLCREGDCAARMFGEKKLRRMYVESMEEECMDRLRAMLRETPFQAVAAGLKEGKA